MQLLKFNKFLYFCIEHHPIMKDKDIWLIRGVRLAQENEGNSFRAEIKKSKWSENFSKVNKICLKIEKRVISNGNFTELKQMIIGEDYVCFYHGLIKENEDEDGIKKIRFELDPGED